MLEKIASLDVAVWIREKMNDLRALAGKVFKRDLFQWFSEEQLAAYRRDNLLEQIVQVWDTAYGDGEENDDRADDDRLHRRSQAGEPAPRSFPPRR